MSPFTGVVVIVTGGRFYGDLKHVCRKLDVFHRRWGISLLRHGACPGGDSTDMLADAWARSRKVPVDPCPADWDRLGKAAGPIRNREMLRKRPLPTALIAFPGGKGTADMVSQADNARGVWLFRVKPRRERAA